MISVATAMTRRYIEDFKDLWTERADSFSKSIMNRIKNGYNPRWFDEIMDGIPEGQSQRILDVGCGPGFFSIVLAKMGHDVTGIDYNDTMIETASNNCSSLGLHAEFIQMDAHDLKFEDGTFDMVVCRDILWNLDDPEKAYSEMYRVLRDGGKLTLFDGNYYLYAHDKAYEKMDVEKHIELYHKGEENCRERLMHVADMATQLPASRERRPQWDVSCLISLGCSRVTAVPYKEERVSFEENGKTVYLPFTFAVSAIK